MKRFKDLHLARAACLAAVLAAFVFLVVPSQTFLASPDLFDYSFAQLLGAGLVGALALGVAAFLVLLVLEFVLGPVASVLGLALVVCLYLETGIFSIGLPALNGVSGFPNTLRMGLDALAWAAVFGVFLLARKPITRHFRGTLAALGVLMAASVFDAGAGGSRVGANVPLSDGFCSCRDVVKSVAFSTNRNVMVFILDMTPATIMTDVMEANLELKKAFPGFTAFRKNLGMHEETAYGLPGLMTGTYFAEKMDRGAFGMTVFGTDSFLFPYVSASNAVFYAGALHPYGYTNRPKDDAQGVSAPAVEARPRGLVFMRHSTSIPNFRMCDAMAIRLAPYYFKSRFYNAALKAAAGFCPSGGRVNRERDVLPILAEAGLTDEPLVLSVIHTDGLHWPITFDRHGNRLAEPLSIEHGKTMIVAYEKYHAAMREAGYYVITQVAAIMDILRQKGVYDNSTIILATDHGCIAMKEGESHGTESALLWVKPERAKGSFGYSDAPTTNAKVHDTLCALREGPRSIEELTAMLSAPERLFRGDFHGVMLQGVGGRLRYRDWFYDEAGKLKEIRQR